MKIVFILYMLAGSSGSTVIKLNEFSSQLLRERGEGKLFLRASGQGHAAQQRDRDPDRLRLHPAVELTIRWCPEPDDFSLPRSGSPVQMFGSPENFFFGPG